MGLQIKLQEKYIDRLCVKNALCD